VNNHVAVWSHAGHAAASALKPGVPLPSPKFTDAISHPQKRGLSYSQLLTIPPKTISRTLPLSHWSHRRCNLDAGLSFFMVSELSPNKFRENDHHTGVLRAPKFACLSPMRASQWSLHGLKGAEFVQPLRVDLPRVLIASRTTRVGAILFIRFCTPSCAKNAKERGSWILGVKL
jgi:hypothetical protein